MTFTDTSPVARTAYARQGTHSAAQICAMARAERDAQRVSDSRYQDALVRLANAAASGNREDCRIAASIACAVGGRAAPQRKAALRNMLRAEAASIQAQLSRL